MKRSLLFIIAFTVLFLGACSSSDAPPVEEAEAPHVPDVATEEITYTVGDVEFTGYFAWDRALDGPRPGVIVVHEWWGHNDYARSRAEQLAAMGYTALALDMFGKGSLAEHPDDAKKFVDAAMADLGEAERRFTTALDLLKGHATVDAERVGAIGYCFGGGVVLHMARVGTDLDVVASFHGSLAPMTPAEPGAVKARVLVFTGEADPMVPADVVAAFEEEMTAAGVDYTVKVYPGATHSFTNPDATAVGEKFGMPVAYDEAADRDSWSMMEAAFAESFGTN
jgi:dienelactone hydrolase